MTKKRLSITDLIKQKEQIRKDSGKKKRIEMYVEELDATVIIEQPSKALVMDALEMGQDENAGDSDEFLVYNIMVEPNLRDKDLQDAYECVEPTDIVGKVFDVGTVTSLAEQGLVLAGYKSRAVPIGELKN